MLLDELVPSESKYLAKTDVTEAGINLTIRGFKREVVGSGDDADERAIIGWVEQEVKPMVLNKTNKNRLAAIFNATTTDELKGKTVNVYNDPMIEYAGRITGGLRIREAVAAPQIKAPEDNGFDDSLPF